MTYNTHTYKRLRREGYGAKYALDLARIDDALDGQELNLFGSDAIGIVGGDWEYETEWGDIQPTEEERERTRSIWVTLTVHPVNDDGTDETEQLAFAAIGGIDFTVEDVNADGWSEAQDAILYALEAYLVPECGWQIANVCWQCGRLFRGTAEQDYCAYCADHPEVPESEWTEPEPGDVVGGL